MINFIDIKKLQKDCKDYTSKKKYGDLSQMNLKKKW